MNNRRGGRTLFETLAVIIIICIIVAISLPKFQVVVGKVNDATIEVTLATNERMVAIEMIENQSYVLGLVKLSHSEFKNMINSGNLIDKNGDVVNQVEGNELYIFPNNTKLLFEDEPGLILVNNSGKLFYLKK